jgi:hypothetical protein
MALPALGFAVAFLRNIKRVLPYMMRSGASVIRRPPGMFFSYQTDATAGSGTLRWM